MCTGLNGGGENKLQKVYMRLATFNRSNIKHGRCCQAIQPTTDTTSGLLLTSSYRWTPHTFAAVFVPNP